MMKAIVLLSVKKEPGRYGAVWDAEKFPSGVYFYRISAGTFTDTKKLLLLK